MNFNSVALVCSPEATKPTPVNENGMVSDSRRYENVTVKDEAACAVLPNTTRRLNTQYRNVTDEKDTAGFIIDHLETSANKLAEAKRVKVQKKDRCVYNDLHALDRSIPLPKAILELDELWKLNLIYEMKVSEMEFRAHLLKLVSNRTWRALLLVQETFMDMLIVCNRLVEGSKLFRAGSLSRKKCGRFRSKKKKQGKKNFGYRTS